MLTIRKAVSCLAVLLVIALAGFIEVGYGSEEILTIASDAHPISFDPTLTAVEMMSPYFDPVYDRLINQNPDGSLIPGLATQRRTIQCGRRGCQLQPFEHPTL
jgi:ABC-type transport system substrate-binding protein